MSTALVGLLMFLSAEPDQAQGGALAGPPCQAQVPRSSAMRKPMRHSFPERPSR